MQVTVSEKMKEWVAGYIRSHRKEGTISVHVVYSKFNEDFRATFKADPQVAIRLMEASGFLKGCPSKGGYSIWLTEDAGKGKGRPYRSRTSRVNGAAASATTETKSAMPIEQKQETGEIEMKKEEKTEQRYSFEKVPHPETGEVNIVELIRYVVKHLHSIVPQNPERDGGYDVVPLSLTDEGQKCGFSASDMIPLGTILQHMGLVKKYGGRSKDMKVFWGVMHKNVARDFVTHRSYELALQKWLSDCNRRNEVTKLRKQLEAPAAEVSVDATQLAEPSSGFSEKEVLDLIGEVDDLTKALETVKHQVVELQTQCAGLTTERDTLAAEIAARPSSTDAVKLMMEERLAAAKKARES